MGGIIGASGLAALKFGALAPLGAPNLRVGRSVRRRIRRRAAAQEAAQVRDHAGQLEAPSLQYAAPSDGAEKDRSRVPIVAVLFLALASLWAC